MQRILDILSITYPWTYGCYTSVCLIFVPSNKRISMQGPITEIQAPTSAEQCSRLRKILNRFATATLDDPFAVSDVELAFGEAFSNAIRYGEGESKVSVRIESHPSSELSVEMAYPGCWFDTTVTYPKDVNNANGGFGRFIMTQVMDSLEYSFHKGLTKVRMVKRQ